MNSGRPLVGGDFRLALLLDTLYKSGRNTRSTLTHLSISQLERFCASALAEDELKAVALHVAECSECERRFVEELRRQRGPGPFAFSLAPEFWFRHDHLDFDQLVDLADEKLEQSTRDIIDIHLTTCETCREDLRIFLAFRTANDRATKESCIEAE